MTQEQKDLLLKDLCTRLPYGVKVQVAPVPSKEYEHITFNAKIVYIDINYIGVLSDWNFVFQQDITEVKPYLFPLSSMTKEQLFEVQEILGKHEIEIEDGFLSIVDSNRKTISYLEILALLEWFYKNHFDIYGLIPMNLAIDATNLNIY